LPLLPCLTLVVRGPGVFDHGRMLRAAPGRSHRVSPLSLGGRAPQQGRVLLARLELVRGRPGLS
jgi:hypothetical protein